MAALSKMTKPKFYHDYESRIKEEPSLRQFHGKHITCIINDSFIEDALVIAEDDGSCYILQNELNGKDPENLKRGRDGTLLGYKYSWAVNSGTSEELRHNRTQILTKEAIKPIDTESFMDFDENMHLINIKNTKFKNAIVEFSYDDLACISWNRGNKKENTGIKSKEKLFKDGWRLNI
jgi:hypothetical protein